MATPAPAVTGNLFPISKPIKIGGRTILTGTANIQVRADPQVIQALATNTKLPLELDPIRLTQVKLGLATGEQSVTFAGGAGNVSFSAGAGVQTGLGVYVKSADMLNDIADLSGQGAQRIPLDEIPFPEVQAARYFAFYWGYNVQASASGSVALGAGAAVTFGAQGSRNRGFAVIRAYKNNPRARSAVSDVFGRSWRLPSQISTVDDLQPGTWILSEVAGSFRANVGVNFGFDYNWIRSVKIDAKEVLQGDIGLKIQAGVSAAFGFNTSGRYVVVVGRDSLDPNEKMVRVRLSRLSQRGWNFAFNANLDLTTTTGTLLPKQLDDFVAAVLGVHGLQTLQEVRRWTDPSQRLSDLASAFLVDYAKNQLGEEFEQKFEEIRQKVIELFNKWDALPSKATSALWDAVRLKPDEVKGFVEKIKEFADPNTVNQKLEEAVADVGFASTPAGKWLLSVVEERLLSVVINRPEVEKVREAAQTTLDILDGKLLEELQDFVENKVGFPVVRKAVEDNDFDSLTDLLQKKLAGFLGKNTPLDGEDFQKVRTTVNRLLERGADLYEAGVKALNQTYKFSFDYAYSKQTTKTALLDVCFDFGANPNLGSELEKAIAGDFTAVLPGPGQPSLTGITFKEAALTHHIQRQAHVKISLPYFTQETIHNTSSLADYKLLSEDGNLYLYALDAEDQVIRKGKWESTLGVGLNLTAGAGSEIRRYDKDGSAATLDYRFIQALPGLRTTQLESLMNPLSRLYFPSEFAASSGVADKLSVNEWAIALDKVVDGQEAAEDGLIGDSLISLNVSLPGDTLLKWLSAPENLKDPVYMNMSRRFQTQLRRFIPLLYFQDPRKYADLGVAQPLLVYASLPITTSVRVSNGTVQLNTNEDLYWNWPDDSASGDRRALIFSSATRERLDAAMNKAVRELSSTPGLRKTAKFYDPDKNLESARATVLSSHGESLLKSLLFVEAELIVSAAKAGRDLAQFRAAVANPPEAVKELAEFGDKLTRTFNAKLRTVFKPKDRASKQLLRNLGLLMFAEVTEALDPGLEVKPTAALEIAVFKAGATFPPDGFPEEPTVPADALNVRQRVLEVGTTA